MEFFGFLAFILLMTYSSSYTSKFKKLDSRIKKLEKLAKGEDNSMSKLLNNLINKLCKITTNEAFAFITEGEVLAVDEEWVQILITDKKGKTKNVIIPIDSIKSIEIL